MSKTLLITGATGKQGGSVISNLLKQDADVEILAVTRDVTSASAQKLASKSPKIKLVQGDLDQAEDIFTSARKVTDSRIWGVFSVQVASLSGNRFIEERQGKSLVDISLKNNVSHFIYTSVDRGNEASLDNPTTISHFISKHNIEHHLINSTKNTSMSWTILRPVAFIDALAPGFIGKAFATSWKVALRGRPLQVIAVSDIGFFGARAFLNPEEYKGRGISLAGDELSFEDMARIFKSKTGTDVPVTFDFVARFLMWMVADFGAMFRWFHDEGYKADIQALRKVHPGLKDFRLWLEEESVWE
ncbi:uncharacterized protein BJX67DRAFT_358758 [Aspergillus lucknowensis]|uniref:NmrA-like domain-containing protein n=1 Tax=Aspergillus lucknowensis TaxID=176173 RepID=A0ABR4LPS8_9EURO